MPRAPAPKAHGSVQAILAGEHDEFVLEYPASRRGEDRWLELRVRRLPRRRGGAAVMQIDVTARRPAPAAPPPPRAQPPPLDPVAGLGPPAPSPPPQLAPPVAAVPPNPPARDPPPA